MPLKYSNFGKATIATPPDDVVGLSFTVETGKGLLYPTLGVGDYFYGIFKNAAGDREIVKIEARSGDTMTIAVGGRGLDGTTPKTWVIGDYFVAGLVNVALKEAISNDNILAFAPLVTSADRAPYYTAPGVAALFDLTTFARSLLDDADAAAARTTLGVPAAIDALLPSGTALVFFNVTAPPGWTQNVTSLDRAIRVVGGAGGGTGGSVLFQDAFKSQAVSGSNSATTLTESQIPSHRHAMAGAAGGAFQASGFVGSDVTSMSYPTGATGGGGSHIHTFTGTAMNLAVRYLDMILCTKD